MSLRDFVSVLADVPTLLALKKGMQPRPLEDKDCLGTLIERNARQIGDLPAVVCTAPDGSTSTVSWAQFNALANRYLGVLKEAGLTRGDVASVMMENRIEFLALVIAANKLGVTAGLINTNLRQRPLSHCITVTGSKKCFFGAEVQDAIQEVKDELELTEGEDYYVVPDAANQEAPEPANWAIDLAEASAEQPDGDPSETGENTLGDTAMYIFTSGTTGLPKAAVLSNRRFLASAQLAGTAGLRCTTKDRIYLCLPLYHGTGLLIGAGASFATGASMFVRRRFSASAFLPEIRQHDCSCFIYVGELCRYLSNSQEKPDDADSPLTTMMGNGLRPDVWLGFKKRFGIKRITEFYGASEGNVAFANLLNKDATIGMTASKVALVRYDVDADEIVRNAEGHCVEVESGQPGLLLGHINPEAVFEGYTDKAATEQKVLRDVFESGDAWFNTGDLIREVDVGFSLGYAHYQFVDRTGDTFRWKSENVSTNEVGDILSAFPGVEFCNVYGVQLPGVDGRAGMAAITMIEGSGELDLGAFTDYVRRELPPFAQPVFLRLLSGMDLTGTYKMVKGDLKREGYDIDEIDDPVYVMKPGESAYERLDSEFLAQIRGSSAGF